MCVCVCVCVCARARTRMYAFATVRSEIYGARDWAHFRIEHNFEHSSDTGQGEHNVVYLRQWKLAKVRTGFVEHPFLGQKGPA